VTGANDTPSIVGEADPSAQAVMVVKSSSPIVLTQGVNDDLLGLNTETFDGQLAGSASNNGAGRGNFHSAALHADFSATGPAGVVLGSSSVTAAPFIGPLPGHQDTTNYLSIGGGGTETITFESDQNVFGLYWGSVDPFNTISFYEGTTLVASYNGANVSPLFSNGNQGSFGSNGYVEFSGVGPFNKVVLGSTSNAFELDNISAGSIHSQLGAPITGGTLSVEDRDIGDTLTASVTGNATIHYTGANGSTQLPNGTNISALIDASDVTFDTAQSNGGTQQLHWTYHPTNPDLDFLQAGDKLTITFNAQVNDGHGNVGSQPLTITLVGANNATDTSAFSVVNGTTANDTFSNVGNNVKVFGGGGDDTFVFKPSFGNATIADFDVTHDAINFSASMFADVAHILASAHQVNQDTIITDAQNDAILLKGVTAGLLQASNFHLV
jgi:VCBS repeat-containing protein